MGSRRSRSHARARDEARSAAGAQLSRLFLDRPRREPRKRRHPARRNAARRLSRAARRTRGGAVIGVFAPAKINLYLHVVGRRADGYHLLDSLVAFADIGDWVTAAPAESLSLAIGGPE